MENLQVVGKPQICRSTMAPPIVIAPAKLERLERAATTEQVSTRDDRLVAQNTNLMAPQKSEPVGNLLSSRSFDPLIDV